MLGRNEWTSQRNSRASQPTGGNLIETLEGRWLLSASAAHHAVHAHVAHHAVAIKHAVQHAKTTRTTAAARSTTRTISASASASASTSTTTSATGATTGTDSDVDGEGQILSTIQFSQAPAAVQSGLKSLASADSLAAPTSTQTVYLGNSNGVETYSLHYTSSGTTTRITVDQKGKPVTQPTETTTTWAMFSGTGAGSNSKAAAEITAIASALGLTAPTASTAVSVSTASNGAVTYSVRLDSSSASTANDYEDHGRAISVDASGNPVGDQYLPFSVMPAAVQGGINSHLPAGASALSSTSTQTVHVLTANGFTLYSTTFSSSGTSSTVTVDSTGALATLPTTTTIQFSTLPSVVQTALQTLATANGVSAAIAASQSVVAYNEGNGTTIYSVTLSATNSSTSQTFNLTISVDQAGNPTVPPGNEGHGGCGGNGGSGDGYERARHRG